MKIFLSFALVFTCALSISSLDLDDVEDGDCISPPADKSFDPEWAFSKERYIFMWAKYDAYKTVASMLDVPEIRLSEDQVERSCPSVTFLGNTQVVLNGFAGTRKLPVDIKIDKEELTVDYTYKPNNRPDGKKGKSVFSLTDNKSFFVKVNCWSEGKKGFKVVTAEKTLDDDTKEKILDHLTELGFDSLKRQENSFDNCLTMPPLAPPTTSAPRPPSPGGDSTGNSNSSGPLSGLWSILRRKIDFLRGLFMTLVRLLGAPVRFIMSALGNLRLGRGGADRG